MFRYELAIIDSHFNFVGYASTLVKKGANESFGVTNYFRDISIEPIETIKEEGFNFFCTFYRYLLGLK